MSPGVRGLLGACLGAAAVLIVHPASRPYVIKPFEFHTRPDPAAVMALPIPKDPVTAAEWIRVAADKSLEGVPLNAEEFRTVRRILQASAKREPDNSYWRQMEAILLNRVGRLAEAEQAWLQAATRLHYNDHQSTRLERLASQKALKYGVRQAWIYAWVYPFRSFSGPKLTEMYARRLVAGIEDRGRRAVAERHATVLNGNLLRDGARSITGGLYGANIVDIATYPEALATMPNPKRLLLAQNDMYLDLAELGRIGDAVEVLEIFRTNDAWRALSVREDYQETYESFAIRSIWVAGLGAMTTAVGLFGGVLLAASWLLTKLNTERPALVLLAMAPILGSLAAFTSGKVEVGLVFLVCVLFAILQPKRLRSSPTDDLGPLFVLVCMILGLFTAAAIAGGILAHSAPAQAVLPSISYAPEVFRAPKAWLGLAWLSFALLFVVATVWASVQRRTTLSVLAVATRRIGLGLSWTGLLLLPMVVPTCMVIDRSMQTVLAQLVANEPVYYYLNR